MTTMKDEDQPRRRFLRQMLTVVPASAVTPVILMQQGCSEAAKPAHDTPTDGPRSQASAAADDYKPTYFTDNEWAFVRAAVDELIPADATGAGGLEAGVPEFIDRQMETPYGHGKLWYMQGPFHPDADPQLGYQARFVPRDIYRYGIDACDAWCEKEHGKKFAELPHETRVQVLEALEAGNVHLEPVGAKLFFATLLKNTHEGYFADPMYGGNRRMAGWKMIGFPGARADFEDWVGQPGAKYPLGPVSILGEQA
jgi:gluconate 2-dehydrogenase gamma chain